MDNSDSERLTRFINVNKPVYNSLLNGWYVCTNYFGYNLYPEWYLLAQIFTNYSFYMKCGSQITVRDHINVELLHKNGYNEIYNRLIEAPVQEFIKILLIHEFIVKYNEYSVYEITHESFDNNKLVLRKGDIEITITIDSVHAKRNVCKYH